MNGCNRESIDSTIEDHTGNTPKYGTTLHLLDENGELVRDITPFGYRTRNGNMEYGLSFAAGSVEGGKVQSTKIIDADKVDEVLTNINGSLTLSVNATNLFRETLDNPSLAKKRHIDLLATFGSKSVIENPGKFQYYLKTGKVLGRNESLEDALGKSKKSKSKSTGKSESQSQSDRIREGMEYQDKKDVKFEKQIKDSGIEGIVYLKETPSTYNKLGEVVKEYSPELYEMLRISHGEFPDFDALVIDVLNPLRPLQVINTKTHSKDHTCTGLVDLAEKCYNRGISFEVNLEKPGGFVVTTGDPAGQKGMRQLTHLQREMSEDGFKSFRGVDLVRPVVAFYCDDAKGEMNPSSELSGDFRGEGFTAHDERSTYRLNNIEESREDLHKLGLRKSGESEHQRRVRISREIDLANSLVVGAEEFDKAKAFYAENPNMERPNATILPDTVSNIIDYSDRDILPQ